MYDLQLIEERIMTIAKSKGLSKNKLLINAKLHKGVFDNMKKGQIPSVDKIHTLADYLDCSVDYLLGRTDEQTSTYHANNINSNFVQGNNSGSISVGSTFENDPNNISLSKEEIGILDLYRSLDIRDRAKFMNFVFEMEDKATKA